MNTLQNRLQLGFAIYIAGSFTLFLQFFLYLLQSNIASTTDFAGYGYYLVAAFAHAGLFALIPYLLYILMSLACPFPRFNQGLLITFYFLLNIVAYLNGLVFQLYKFHINGLVLDMVFGQDAGQVFNFETSLILRFALTILAVGFLFSGIIWIAYRFYQRLRRRQIILYLVLFVCSTLSAHLVHAYAAASNQFSIQNVATCLPQFYPLTANKLMAKLGIIHHPVSHPQLNDNTTLNTGITYPLHPLISNDTVSRKNIIFILLDSWNPRILDTETMPNLSGFATRSSVFTHHLSSSSGTRGSIFGLFFGISPTYWKAFELSGTSPLFIQTLLEQGYDVQTFPSATLQNPPFDRIIFGEVPHLRTETQGATPFDRDTRLTADFLQYLDQKPDKPFFAFLFYDLLHAISIPAPHRHKFEPSWEYANYMALNNEMDATPFFNLYRNCGWYVDSLVGSIVGELEHKGLLDNSILVITGDHSQEFNENKKNYWGHGSNYSDAQIHVPFIYYEPGQAPRNYHHTTTHYDIVPTLMHTLFGVSNPPGDYSMGHFLTDSLRPLFHLTGTEENYAFVTPEAIYEKKHSGRIVVTDSLLNPIDHPMSPQLLKEVLEYKNRFRKKD